MKYINKGQKYSSKNTSINKDKLPAIYGKINWEAFKATKGGVLKILDYGAGKYTKHIKQFINSKGLDYFPFDPYNCSDEENESALLIHPDIIICSNVLNVVAEDVIINNIHSYIRAFEVPYFITVWDGNKSKIGGPTRYGYQRNLPTSAYLFVDEIIRKEVITLDVYKGYIK